MHHFSTALLLTLTSICFSQDTMYSTDTLSHDPIVISGMWDTALAASFVPDASRVSVYIMIGKEFPYDPEEYIAGFQSYFDHYGLPVVYIINSEQHNGPHALFRFYVNGVAMEGDLSSGCYSLQYIKYRHDKVFADMQSLYAQAN